MYMYMHYTTYRGVHVVKKMYIYLYRRNASAYRPQRRRRHAPVYPATWTLWRRVARLEASCCPLWRWRWVVAPSSPPVALSLSPASDWRTAPRNSRTRHYSSRRRHQCRYSVVTSHTNMTIQMNMLYISSSHTNSPRVSRMRTYMYIHVYIHVYILSFNLYTVLITLHCS